MKKQKNTVKARIILIFILFFFLLILCCNNKSYAKSWGSISDLLDRNGYANTNLRIGDTVTGASMDDVFGNKSIYCIEAGQEYIENNYEYKLKKIIEVDDTTNKDFQPLLYIFANYPKSSFASSSDVMPYFNNASQIALWGTIKAKNLNNKNSCFKAEKCVVKNSNYGYDSIYTYYAPSVGGGGSYDVQRPYFAIYVGDSSRPRYYGVASTQTRFPGSLGVLSSARDRYKKASHLGYLVYQKATAHDAQKYKGKIYVFSSHTSQNFIIFSKPEKIAPTITLNLYKKDNANSKMKNAKARISMNNNIKTINGGTDDIIVSSNSKAGKFDTIAIVPTNNSGTVKINLQETDAPSNGIAMPDKVVLTISYNTTTGAITGISTDKNNNYFDFISATEIDLINPNVPEWYIYKVNQDGNVVKKEVIFDTTITITGGRTYNGTYKTNSSTGKTGNIISEAAQKELAQKYMDRKIDVTAKVTITERKVKGYGDPVTCSFKLTYNGIKLTASDLKEERTTYKEGSKCEIVSNTTYITIKNIEIKPIWITVKKVDNENKGIGPAKFNVSFVQDRTTTNSNLTIQGTGGVYYNTTTFNPKSYKPITVTIDETEGPAHFNKSDTSVVLQFNWKGKEETGYWEPTIISGKDQLVEFTDSEFSDLTTNKYYPSNSERLVRTDKTETRDFNHSFGLKIRNDPRIIKNTKLYKYDITGNYAVKGAVFTAEFSGVTYVKINGNRINATGNKVTVTGLVSDANGLIANIQEIEALENSDTVYMTVTETKNVSGYSILPNPVNLILKYDKKDSSGGKWKLYENTDSNKLSKEYFEIKSDELTLNIKDDYKLDKLTILKTDSLDSNNKVEGAKFDVTLGNVKSVKGYSASSSGTVTIQGVTTNKNGNIELEDVVIKDITKPVTVTMTETEAPEGYKKIEGKVTVKLIRDGNTYKITEQSKDSTVLDSEFKEGNAKVEGNVLSIGINDIPALQELDLIKKDSQDGEKELSDAEFKLKFDNVKYYYINGTKYTDATKDGVKISDGVEKILPADINQPMTITLEETKAPVGYKRIEGKIYLIVRYTDEGYTISATKDETVSADKEFNTSDVGIENGKNAYVTMKDIPLINIGGIVWEDEQTGTKQISGPDGKLNNGETGISGIGVEIYNEKDERVYQDIYGDELVDTTAGNGQEFSYKLNNGNSDKISLNAGEYIFPNLEKGEYYVKFLYDGINYKTVNCSSKIYDLTSPKESKVTEEGRDAFNARFKTISPGQSNDGTKLGYDYNEAEKTSKLQVGIKGENPANDNEFDFQMKAKSENYLRSGDADWIKVWNDDGTINRDHYALDVNCGLTKKYFDLALGTDVKSARVTINGKEATYDYAQIMDGKLEDLDLDKITQNNSSETDGIEYTLYLYNSDYNFRIQDYTTDMTTGVKDTTSDIKDTTSDSDHSVISGNENESDELQVYVTYSIVLKNQSKQSGTVNKFVYYYDSKYTPYEITSTDRYTVDTSEGGKITFTSNSDGLSVNESDDYRQEIDITFRIKKDPNRYVLKGEFSNAGEIIEYSTPEGGLIDYDSAPGNAEFGLGEQKTIAGHYEDDCDEAKGLKIEKKEEKTREITGNVFEDIDKNGVNNDSKTVNDVIVQLIEIKTIGGEYYEYIWQQTRSGSNKVLTTTRYGYDPASNYNSNATGDGVYQFKDFIPGNYIIRFIYGDGATYDIEAEEYKNSAENVKKYNGQDYKSTKDIAYTSDWYKKSEYTDEYEGADDIANKARDNEARRLTVMSYSTDIDNAKGQALKNKNKDALKATWMCAETSRVYIPVDNKERDMSGDKDKIMFEKTDIDDDVLKLEHMNFGLTLRPNTKLKLEKHITALKITPQGTGVQPIVDAKIGDILEDLLKKDVDKVNVNGVKTGLAVIKSNRDDRGFWKVETDIEELAQGAKVEVEYRYIVKNESEVDYLSKTLVDNYKDAQKKGDMKEYSDKLTSKYVTELKEKMRKGSYAYKSGDNSIGEYLGEYYYNYNSNATNIQEVPSAVTGIEDTINAEFKINEGAENDNAFEQDTSTKTDKYKYDVDGKREKMNNIATIQNKTGNVTKTLIKDVDNATTYTDNNTDYSLIVNLETTLSAASKEISYAGCLAQITHYTNAAGKRDIDSVPGNLEYVSSDDNELTLNSYVKYYNNDKEAKDRKIIQVAKNQADAESLGGLFFKLNEDDEYWGLGGEKLIVSKPTGENKQAPVQIIVIAISSVAVIGVGIILIKKFVLKK